MTDLSSEDCASTQVPPHDEQQAFTSQSHTSQGTSGFSTAESPNCRHEANVEVVYPYAIEEPDDEPTDTEQSMGSKGTPMTHLLLRDSADGLQGELVDSMEGLYCDSDNSSHRVGISQRRGKKRKSPGATPGSVWLFRRSSSSTTPDVQYEQRSGSPKRPPKRSRHSREQSESLWQRYTSDTGSSGSFTSLSPSTDTSGATPDGYPGTDSMDTN
ncbi:hypothetical protein BO70DRAFT_357810 [Aspergillus heteromorphus CBS 117.55]|uniref:Uncharacterized protein n=1 Tax=Aspergillus heteromorphus CBS 117.55 TaxID=1448321 RepID=A0A317X2U7_9EURO|nr:uncharacterized protein BO70DRAFT_357810 [Aspergillus heteromorphus CBS 117.55]PWY92665.1 hypothetical protein BO70DRAFT_357810 [Aspergillus heteromorphus CBS 117.55]